MLREVSQPLAWGSLLYCVPITTNSVTSKGTINEATVSVGQESGMAPPGPWAQGHSAAVQVILSAVPGPFPAHTAGGRNLVLWLEAGGGGPCFFAGGQPGLPSAPRHPCSALHVVLPWTLTGHAISSFREDLGVT